MAQVIYWILDPRFCYLLVDVVPGYTLDQNLSFFSEFLKWREEERSKGHCQGWARLLGQSPLCVRAGWGSCEAARGGRTWRRFCHRWTVLRGSAVSAKCCILPSCFFLYYISKLFSEFTSSVFSLYSSPSFQVLPDPSHLLTHPPNFIYFLSKPNNSKTPQKKKKTTTKKGLKKRKITHQTLTTMKAHGKCGVHVVWLTDRCWAPGLQ